MLKILFPILIILSINVNSQIIESTLDIDKGTTALSNGFIDLGLNGGKSLQTSASLMKIIIGEGDFRIPFYFITGANTNLENSDEEKKANLVNQIFSSTAGILNFSISDNRVLKHTKSTKSSLNLYYHLTYKGLMGSDTSSDRATNLINCFQGGVGFYGQAPAEISGTGDKGFAWLLANAYIFYAGTDKMIQNFGKFTKGFMYVFFVGAGISIKDIINLKITYNYNWPLIPGYDRHQIKIGMDINPKKNL